MPFLILLGLVVLVALWAVGIYNRLVGLRNQTQNGWRQIDVQLKRRHDLIPNLVNTVKGAMEFERDTLTAVMEARAKAMGAAGPADAANMVAARFGFAPAELYQVSDEAERAVPSVDLGMRPPA